MNPTKHISIIGSYTDFKNRDPNDVEFRGTAEQSGAVLASYKFDADTPKIQITKDGAIWYAPRGSRNAPAISVVYPDMDKIATLGAFYVNGPPGYPFKATVFADRQPARPATTTAQGR